MVVLEQRLDRAEADHLVGGIAGQLIEFTSVQRHVSSADKFPHDRPDLVQDFILGRVFKGGQIETIDEMAMEFDLERQEIVTMRGDLRGRNCRS